MIFILKPEYVRMSTRPDGTVCVHLLIDNGKRDTDIVFTPELWAKLSADARWFVEHKDDPVPAPMLAPTRPVNGVKR